MDATQEQKSESSRGGEASSGLGRLNEEQRSYLRFGVMIVTATVVMFLFMYLNTYRWDHIRWSETRAYMALLMGGTMAVIMLAFMLGMYKNWKINLGILGAALVLFGGSLWLVRSQATVDDSSYMNAMIPHHSIAILTSENDDIRDVRVRELADEILVAQRREIDEMKWLIGDIEENGVAETQQEAEARPVPDFQAEP